MKNLQNYGVQALNAKEIKETDGGFFATAFLTVLGVAVIGYNFFVFREVNKGITLFFGDNYFLKRDSLALS